MMYVQNFDETLPKCKEFYIKIDKQTRKIDNIPGIKIKPFEHQQVLAQQIIEHIEKGKQNLYNGKIVNINQWIKASIGTGKSLIAAMVLQYFKNKQYKTIPLTVPYKSDILTGVKKHDDIPFKANQFGGGYYQCVYNQDYVLHEILKTTGFHYTDSKYIKEIKFNSVKPQSLLFVQNQVSKQFQKYFQTQTSLTYYVIDSNLDFIKYMIDYDNIKQDIIIWNTNNVNIQQSLINIQSQLKQLYMNIDQRQIIDKMEYIRQFYTIDKQYSFNKFWIEHMNNRQKEPFAFVCFDDFDTMQLENFQWIPSLVNMYIGTTMIQKNQQSINQCSGFIFNKLVNKYSAFGVVPEQIKEILKFPKVNINNVLCKTQSNVFAQYRLMEYINKLYKEYLWNDKKVYTSPTQKDYSDLMSGIVNIDQLYKKYICQFNINKINMIDVYLNLTIQLQLIFKINLCDKKIEKGGDKVFYEQKIKQYKEQLFNEVDNSFINLLIEEQQKNPKFLTEFQKKCVPFVFNDTDLINSQIFDIIDNTQILSKNVCLTTCCCMMFNKQNAKKAVNVNGLDYYCSFCKRQIPDIKQFIWHDQTYLQEVDFQTSPIFIEQQIQQGQTKIEQILKILNENTKYTDGKVHTYLDGNEEEVKKQNKITILYSEDVLQFDCKYSKIEFDIDNLVEDINQSKPIYIYPYQYDQNYQQFIKDQEFELQSIFMDLSRKHPDKFQQLSDAFKTLKSQIKKIPDVIQIKSIQQITGENMVYVDNFIFATIPQDYNEFLQIIGRSNRIQRKEENDVFMLYYPHQDILEQK